MTSGNNAEPPSADVRVGGLSSKEWNRLAGPYFYSTALWLQYCATDTAAELQAAIVHDADGTATGAIPAMPVGHLQQWSRYRWNECLSERDLPLLPAAGWIVGPSEGFQTNWLLGSTAESGELGSREERVADLVANLRSMAGEDEAVVAMYMTTNDVLLAKRAGVESEPVLLDLDAWIDVPGASWETWLNSLSSRRRRSIKREVRAFEAAGYDVTHEALGDCFEELGQPSAALLRKYGHDTTLDDEIGSLRLLARQMGDAARVAVCRRAGITVGFCIYYLHGGTCFIRWAGFDHTRLTDSGEYFYVCYYTHLKHAAEFGTSSFHAGATASKAKAGRGAKLGAVWLLDLTADSVFVREREQVKTENRRTLAKFAEEPIIADAIDYRELAKVLDG